MFTYILGSTKWFCEYCFPALFQCCGDKQWGDWRPHLAVILSNQSGDPELHQRAIVTMGDTLGKQKLSLLPPSLGHLQASCTYLSLDFQSLGGAGVYAQAFRGPRNSHVWDKKF